MPGLTPKGCASVPSDNKTAATASIAKYIGKVVAVVLPTSQLARLGPTALVGLLLLAVLLLAAICWVIGSEDRSIHVAWILLARAGNPEAVKPTLTRARSEVAGAEQEAGTRKPSRFTKRPAA